MAAPTQEYPPWLTPSAVVSTNAAGEVVTSTTIVYLPLTYLGPSIPLNSLYTYGGSTYPPTIVTGFITTTPAPTTSPSATTTTSATPTTTLPTTSDTTSTVPPTTLPTSSTSSTTTTSTSSPTTASSTTSSSSAPTAPTTETSFTISPVPTESFPSTSPSPTSTSNGPSATEPSSVGSLSRGQLVGVIVASILGLIFLFVFLLAFWLWCKGRRNRRRSGEFSTITPLEEDYFIVGEDGRTPGEGSPRHSGEEGDSLLRASQNVGATGGASRTPSPGMTMVPAEMGARRPSVTRVPVPNTGSLSSSGSSSNASGYGTLLDRPTLGILPPTAEEDHPFAGGGYTLSDDEMREINRESVLPQEEQEPDYTGAYAITKDPELAPPRLIDPDNAFSHPEIPHPQLPPPAQQNRFSAQSAPSIADAEDAALLTARRVHVSDLPASGFHEDGSPAATRSGFLGAIGLTGLAGIGRLSWFNSGESLGHSGRYSPHLTPEPQRRSRRYSPTFSPIPMTDEDVEAGRTAMAQRSTGGPDIDSFGRVTRPTIAGLDLSGQRPISGLSARSGTSGSGQTVYHDARSSMPGTPAAPRVATPMDIGAELALPEHAWLAGAIAGPAPPAYQDDDPFIDHSGDVPRMDLPQPVPPSTDILDMPAPSALSHFQSSSSHFQSNTTNSDRDSATMSSIGLSRNPFPPGLDFMAHVKEVSGGMTWTPDGSLSAATSGSASSPLWQMHHVVAAHEEIDNDTPTIDILEEEPPEARDTWRSINTGAGGVSELGRRTTFGLPLYHHPAQIPSEQGSLHSMRSHVDPPSVRSTGSAPASVSIRSSPYGLGRPGSLHSSVHSGSLSSTSSSHRSEASASSSIARELVRSGSIISDSRGRRYDSRAGGSPSTSGMPPLSPFGQSRFATPPRSTRSGLSQVANAPSHYSGEAIFKDGEIPTVDGPASDDGHFSPGASTIRTVNSGTTVHGSRTRTVSAVTFGSAGAATVGLGLSNAVAPIESAEEGDLGLLNEINAGRRLGPAWMS